jgi:hypothetical protein
MNGPRAPRASKVAPFSRYLRERLAALPQLTGRRLRRELCELNYIGGYSILTGLPGPPEAASNATKPSVSESTAIG